MAFTEHPITGDISDLFGEDYPTTGNKLTLKIEAAQSVLGSGSSARTGGVKTVPVAADGTVNFDIPEGIYRFIIDSTEIRAARGGNGGGNFSGIKSGWVEVTEAMTLGEIAEGYFPPAVVAASTYASVAALVEQAEADAAAAQAARNEAVDISGISTSDDVVEALVKGTAGAGPKTRDALSATIATVLDDTLGAALAGVTPAVPTGTINGLGGIGDSTMRGTYTGDSEPGITPEGGSPGTVRINGMSWLTWFAAFTGLPKGRNAAVTGNTIAEMDARVTADVIDPGDKRTAIAVCSGYNDAFDDVSVEDYMTSYASVCQKLKAAQLEAIACTPLPTANNAGISTRLSEYAAAIRTYAAAHGLFLLDLHALTLNESTGHMIDAVKTDGDGVHPGAAGQVALARIVMDALRARLPRGTVPLVRSLGDRGCLTPNRGFTGTPTSGKAPNVFDYAAPAGVSFSVVTGDEFMVGNWQRVTHAATATPSVQAQRVTTALTGNRIDPGDVVAITGYVTTSGVAVTVGPEWQTAPFNEAAVMIPAGVNIDRGLYYGEFTVPDDFTTDFLDIMLTTGPGTGYVEFAELSVYNLTKMGLSPA